MKLNKLQFAKLIGFLTSNGFTYGDWEIERVDELIDFDIPVPDALPRADFVDVDELLNQIGNPDGFIPAIKAYRVLTGVGLKEAKEAIKRYRLIPKFAAEKDDTRPNPENATLGDIFAKVADKL